jgi:hypothetical protein
MHILEPEAIAMVMSSLKIDESQARRVLDAAILRGEFRVEINKLPFAMMDDSTMSRPNLNPGALLPGAIAEDGTKRRMRPSHRYKVNADDVRKYIANLMLQPVNRGGAPTKADWAAIEEAYVMKVREDGAPNKGNEPGWQTQADVGRWIVDIVGGDVGRTTVMKWARILFNRYRGHK